MKEYDVIIVGGGPAGLTASIYALRSGCSVLLFEGNFFGGQSSTSHEIVNYPGIENIAGIDLAMKMHSQAEKLGLVTEYDFVTKIDCKNKVVSTKSSDFKAVCIILAMGAKSRKLGIEKEPQYLGRGIHYCATCDGGFYKGKDVVVVGGGNSSAEDAIYLSNICKSVNVLVRGKQFKCQDVLLDKLTKLSSKNKITVNYNTTIKEIVDNNGVISAVKVLSEDKDQEIKTDGIFIAIGREPDTELVQSQIKLDENGYVVADEKMHTSADGVFVAGDVRQKSLRQIITACADGAIAGNEANLYVNNKRG